LRVAPERCIVVEDSVTGASAAVAAGMTVLGFVDGANAPQGQAEKLRNVGANAVFYSMRELPLLVENWTQDQLAATSMRD
jgi:beta-phosphoglucomutase-like phosphatase (HAD superfamily)